MNAMKLLAAVAVLAMAQVSFAQDAPAAAKITDLAWMAGSWVGTVEGGGILQETWLPPAGGTMSAAVRMIQGDETEMVELIVIEEVDGSLVFRLQQWSKSFAPRMPGPQKLILAEIGDNRAHFVPANEDNAFRSLIYSRPSAEAFHIELALRDPPQTLKVELQPQ